MVVNPPGYSEHNCGLAADLNSPEHADLTRTLKTPTPSAGWCEYAGEYGFILQYPKKAEDRYRDHLTSPGTGGMWGRENAARSTQTAVPGCRCRCAGDCWGGEGRPVKKA